MALKFRRGSTADKSGSLAFGEPFVNTSLTTLQVGGNSGDITLATVGSTSEFNSLSVSASSFVSASNLHITSNALIKGNLTLNGNTTIGDSTSDTVTFAANISSSLIPSINNAFDLGSESKIWRDLYISSGSIKMFDGAGALVSTITATSLNSNTSSVNALNSFSASVIATESIINTFTSSVNTATSSLNSFSASVIATGSLINTFTASVNTFSASVIATGSLINTFTSSVNSFSASVIATGSIINTFTSSVNTFSASVIATGSIINTFTSSVNTSTASLNSFSSSILDGIQLTGSNVTIKGDLLVKGTTTTINSTTVNIGDNIIQLNGTGATNAGIVVQDATGATTTSGSLLWDTTNDRWIAGALGSEIELVNTTGTQTLTNKTIAAGSNTISGLTNSNLSGTAGITNANLANSAITIAGTSTSLGGSITAATILAGTGVFSGSAQLPTGVVSGSSQVFSNISGDVLIASNGVATIQANSVTLGTDTTGDYVSSLVAGTNITLSNNSGEGATPTIGLTNNTITIAGNSTALGGSITAATILAGTGVISGSAQLPSGVVSGSSQVFSNISGDILIASNGVATIQANSVALGTDTTGNYMSDVSAGNAGIVISHTPGEGSTATISLVSGVVSGSSQITAGSTTNFATDVKTQLNSNTVISGSSQVFSNISGDVLIASNGVATIQANSVALGTDTTGNYVASLVAGTNITLSNNSGEGATPTIGLTNNAITIAGTSTSLGGTITAAQIGNAIGAISGSSQVFSNVSGDITIDSSGVATIANNSVLLGTDTVGSYVASLVAGTGITLTNNSGESATPTIAIAQAISTTSNVQFGSLGIGMAASGTTGRIDATNDIVAFSSSDKRFKNNLKPIEKALEKIEEVGGYEFDWNEQLKSEHGYEGHDIGVIAQEIEAIAPELVQTRENGYKAVKYDKIIPILIQAIKELSAKVKELESK